MNIRSPLGLFERGTHDDDLWVGFESLEKRVLLSADGLEGTPEVSVLESSVTAGQSAVVVDRLAEVQEESAHHQEMTNEIKAVMHGHMSVNEEQETHLKRINTDVDRGIDYDGNPVIDMDEFWLTITTATLKEVQESGGPTTPTTTVFIDIMTLDNTSVLFAQGTYPAGNCEEVKFLIPNALMVGDDLTVTPPTLTLTIFPGRAS